MRCDMIYDTIRWYDIWYDAICDAIRNDLIWHDIWYDIWYDIRYDMIWYECPTVIYADQYTVRIVPVRQVLTSFCRTHSPHNTTTPSQPISKHQTQRTIRSHTIETSFWYSELQPMMQQPIGHCLLTTQPCQVQSSVCNWLRLSRKQKDFISEFNAIVVFLYLHVAVVSTSICHSSFSPSSKNRATTNIKSHPFVCSFVGYLVLWLFWMQLSAATRSVLVKINRCSYTFKIPPSPPNATTCSYELSWFPSWLWR